MDKRNALFYRANILPALYFTRADLSTTTDYRSYSYMTKKQDIRSMMMGFFRHVLPKLQYEKDCLYDNPQYCYFVQIKPIPDGLLPSRARFRFSLTVQNYKILSNDKKKLFFCPFFLKKYLCLQKFLQALLLRYV